MSTFTHRLPLASKKLKDFDRGVLRSAVSSLFWSVIIYRKKYGKYTLQNLADTVGKDKSEVSRWFAKHPNWQLNTIADIANALDLELEIRAKDRSTGRVFSPHGEVKEVKAEIIYPDEPQVRAENAASISTSPDQRNPRLVFAEADF